MQLILFSIRRQWTSNLLQKLDDENPLASGLLMRVLIYKLKPKEISAHLCPGFLHAPCYSVTINRKPEKNLHILQCDADLTMWHVEGESRAAIATLRPLSGHGQSLYSGSRGVPPNQVP